MGPNRYGGYYIRRYQIYVCLAEFQESWEGWAPEYEKRLIGHLKEEGLRMPKRNARGWLPRN